MSLLSSLVGGSSSSSSSSDRIFGPQADFMRDQYYPYLTDLMSRFSGSPESMIAGFTPEQMVGQNYALGFAGEIPGIYNQSRNAQGELYNPTASQRVAGMTAPFSLDAFAAASSAPGGTYGRTLDDLMSGNVNLDAYNPVADSVASRLTQNFRENILPGIRRNSLQASGVPTSRAAIPTQQAASQFTQDLGATLNNLYLPAYQQAQQQRQVGAGMYGDALNRRLSAAGMGFDTLRGADALGSENLYRGISLSPMLAELGYQPANIFQDVGGQRQAFNQTYLDAPFNLASRIQSLYGTPIVLGQSSSSGTQNRGLTQGFADLFGGGGSSAAGAALAFSDRRLKDVVIRIGERLGLSVYLFRYVWGEWAIGHMADEVKAKYPHAVHRHPSGYDMVDYGAIA